MAETLYQNVPHRLRILQVLTWHLEGIDYDEVNPITKLNYRWSVKGKVFRGRKEFGEETALPLIALLEAPKPEPFDYVGYEQSVAKGNWPLYVQGFVSGYSPSDPAAAGAQQIDAAYELCAVVMQRLSMISEKTALPGKGFYDEIYMLGKRNAHELKGERLIGGLEIREPLVMPAEKGVSSSAFFYIPVGVQHKMDFANPYVTVAC